MWVIFTIISSLIFPNSDAANNRLKPYQGSRSLVVANHQNHSDSLCVTRRSCACKDNSLNDRAICDCWANFAAEDQPAVQGDPRIFVYYFLQILSPDYGFQTEDDWGFGAQFIKPTLFLPSPKKLQQLLRQHDLESKFFFVENEQLIATEQYLNLLSQGKMPISNISNDLNDVHAYQHYFHDIFVHFFIWFYMPDDVYKIIKERAHLILDIAQKMKNELRDDELGLALIDLMLMRIAATFDIGIGTLNNNILTVKNQGLSSDDSFPHYFSEARKKVISHYLEAVINFGLMSDYQYDGHIRTNINNRQFIYDLSLGILSTNQSAILNENQLGFINDDTIIRSIKKYSNDEINEKNNTLNKMLLNLYDENNNPIFHLKPFMSVDAFLCEIKEKIEALKLYAFTTH